MVPYMCTMRTRQIHVFINPCVWYSWKALLDFILVQRVNLSSSLLCNISITRDKFRKPHFPGKFSTCLSILICCINFFASMPKFHYTYVGHTFALCLLCAWSQMHLIYAHVPVCSLTAIPGIIEVFYPVLMK